jgi:hypothetical protein
MEILHFRHDKNVGKCVKQMLARVHGGIMWMDRPIHIDFDLI